MLRMTSLTHPIPWGTSTERSNLDFATSTSVLLVFLLGTKDPRAAVEPLGMPGGYFEFVLHRPALPLGVLVIEQHLEVHDSFH